MRIKLIAAAAFLLLAVAGLFILQRIKSSDEEAPIIVRNGSIEIETLDGTWTAGTDEWTNETVGKGSANELWVKVTSSTGTCRGSGKPVHIRYSQPGVQVMFTTRGFWWTAKTRVSPKSGVTLLDSRHLRAGTAGAGYITEVQTQSVTCSLSPTSANVEINICSSSSVTACQ